VPERRDSAPALEGMERMTNRPPNGFLRSLTNGDFELLRPHLHDMKLEHSKVLFDVGGKIPGLYFPHSGVISLVVVLADGDLIEAGMIGRDGVVGTAAALDDAVALNRAVVQIGGAGSVIDMVHAQAAVTASRALRKKLYQHDQILLAQAQQSAACNAKHQVEERLCRWLLRTRDLVGEDNLPLTQEYIAQMLGVRRTSVTLAARNLQAAKLIKYRRGLIQVVDVEALQEAACECHEAVRAQAARMIPPVEIASTP
jgi:CRP-like cAMP-binding protein